MLKKIKLAYSLLLTSALIYFFYLMVLITWQYVPPSLTAGFLRLKFDVINLKHYQIAFFSHVYSSIWVLLIAPIQVWNWPRRKFAKAHQLLGKVYVFVVLFIAAPSGFVMSLYAEGGWFTKTSFVLQSVLWFLFTYLTYKFATKQNWELHRAFALRSVALTFSAISLRAFKWLIVALFELGPMDTYQIVSWLGWVINLAIVELYLSFTKKS